MLSKQKGMNQYPIVKNTTEMYPKKGRKQNTKKAKKTSNDLALTRLNQSPMAVRRSSTPSLSKIAIRSATNYVNRKC